MADVERRIHTATRRLLDISGIGALEMERKAHRECGEKVQIVCQFMKCAVDPANPQHALIFWPQRAGAG